MIIKKHPKSLSATERSEQSGSRGHGDVWGGEGSGTFLSRAPSRGLVGDGLLGPPPTRLGRKPKPVVAEYDFTPMISQ